MKRRISDLLDGIPALDVELNQTAPLSSSRIKELTMSKIQNKKPRRIAFRVLGATAVIAMMALTVFAVGSGAEWFKMFFTEENGEVLSDEQIALIEQSAVPIDQSQTVDGYTIYVESVLNDERTVYVKMNLYAPEGVALPYEDNRLFETVALYNSNGELVSSGWGMGEPIDKNKTDNLVEIIMSLSIEENTATSFLLDGGGAILELTNLYKVYGRPLSQKKEMMAEGTWQFDLTFGAAQEELWEYDVLSQPVPCTMVKYHTGEETEIFLTSICLRALTIDVVYDYPDGADLEPLYWQGMKIVKKDGTAIRVLPSDERIGPEGDKITGYMSLEPNAPIVLDEVAYIEFPGGIQIPVNDE